MGPFVFSMRPDLLDEHFRTRPHERALFIARPGDLTGGHLLHVVRDLTGEERFQVIEVIPDPEPRHSALFQPAD